MNLEQIYNPVREDLEEVENLLESTVKESQDQSINAMSNTLLESSGKRLRPALVLLSGRLVSAGKISGHKHNELVRLAAAVELIHIASLIHDDILDAAVERRGKPTVNKKLGDNISIIFGDYIYSKAFELIGMCRNPDVFECISQAVRIMCEGELIQVCRRGNLELSKHTYIAIVSKKTASLFAACCHAGTILGNNNVKAFQAALKGFGLNFGIAFQIIDDYRDIVGEKRVLGKNPGQDVSAGDITLPLLNLLDAVDETAREEIKSILASKNDESGLNRIRSMFINSDALTLTRKNAQHYLTQAKCRLREIDDSEYKKSLVSLTGHIAQQINL